MGACSGIPWRIILGGPLVIWKGLVCGTRAVKTVERTLDLSWFLGFLYRWLSRMSCLGARACLQEELEFNVFVLIHLLASVVIEILIVLL